MRSGWLLAALACAAGLGGARAADRPEEVIAIVVHREVARGEQVWDGVVEAVNAATLSAQTNARVLELPYDVDDVVPAGAVLVRFTDVEQSSATRAAQAQIAATKAAYINAQANYQRIAAIYAKGLIARADLDLALAQRDAARSALEAAQAQWRQVGQQFDYTVVRAPYAAIVTRRYVQVGESVQSGPPVPQPLIAIESLDELRVNVQVPQSAAAAIRRYLRADVLADGGTRRIAADKVSVFPYADPDTHSFGVRVAFPGKDAGLYPGMTVKVAFATGEVRRLMVPVSALVERGELRGVYVLGADGVALRQVRVGARDGDRVQVMAGLDDGERIAVDPAAALRWLARERQVHRP
jgi:RND family efflux transporter MFP subunit